MRLEEALNQMATGALRRMASVHGLPYDDGTTRAELIDRLADRLLDVSYLAEQLRGLTDDERAALAAARSTGGEQRGLLIERDHPGASDALVERGLLFRVFASTGTRRGEVLSAPDEVLALLPAPPRVEPPPAHGPSPAVRRTSDSAFSLFCIASALARNTSQLESEVVPWAAEPGGWTWDARWIFLRHLAQIAGLLVHQADGALVAGPSLARLLDDPAALSERLRRHYLSDRSWSDLLHSGIEGGDELAESVQLRQALVGAVHELPVDSWIEVAAFSDWVRRTHPALVREQLNARGLVVLESKDWAALEASVLRYVGLGPLYWLGVVASSPDGRFIARRATPQTAFRVAAEPCTWEGAAELNASPRAALGTLLEAERYLVLHERGRRSRYHLVQRHIAAALGSGGSIADCQRLLLRLTQTELPESVATRLAAWERRFGVLSVRPAVVLEARSESDLDAALADERVRPFVRARLGPTVAEVAAADALELAAALRESEHLPRVDAALRLSSDPRRAYAGLVDEQVLEFLLVSLLAFRAARPERLAELEGSLTLLERLERQFPPERLAQLRTAAAGLAGQLGASPPPPRSKRSRRNPKRRTL